MSKYSAGDIGSGIFFGFIGLCASIFVLGLMIFLGQQLLWQLRRTDCGIYTVAQQKDGNIPLQCTHEKASNKENEL